MSAVFNTVRFDDNLKLAYFLLGHPVSLWDI